MSLEGDIERIGKCLQENVVIKYNDRQEIAKIKGVDEHFDQSDFDSLVVMGRFDLGDTSRRLGVFGGGLSSKLGLFPGGHEPVNVYVPRRDVEYNSLDPSASLNFDFLQVSGIFIVHEEIDNEIFITDLSFAQQLLGYKNAVSSLELQLKPDGDRENVRDALKELLGPDWVVKTREEQNELIYKIFKSEKWFTYAILSLVLFISAFNIFGSLIMLVLDKKQDISVLKGMGASRQLIRRVFMLQGGYISVIGASIGMILGVLIVMGQQRYGWLQMQNSIVDAYPVKLAILDIGLTLLTVILLGYIMSIYPAARAGRIETENLN